MQETRIAKHDQSTQQKGQGARLLSGHMGHRGRHMAAFGIHLYLHFCY